MHRYLAARRVIETRSGRYSLVVIPLLHSPLPGFRATALQAVRADDPDHPVRLTLFERDPASGDPLRGPRAA